MEKIVQEATNLTDDGSRVIPIWVIEILLEYPDTKYCIGDISIGPSELPNIQLQWIKLLNRSIIYIWTIDKKDVFYYDSSTMNTMTSGIEDPLLFAKIQTVIIRTLYEKHLVQYMCDDISSPIRKSRWCRNESIRVDKMVKLHLAELPAQNPDEYSLDWYVVESITSLGTHDRNFPLAKSELAVVSIPYSILYLRAKGTNMFKQPSSPLELRIVMDIDNHPAIAIYYNPLTMESEMQCFNENVFWDMYEYIAANTI